LRILEELLKTTKPLKGGRGSQRPFLFPVCWLSLWDSSLFGVYIAPSPSQVPQSILNQRFSKAAPVSSTTATLIKSKQLRNNRGLERRFRGLRRRYNCRQRKSQWQRFLLMQHYR